MGCYKVSIRHSAVAELGAAPFPFRRQINQRLMRLKEDPRPADAELVSEKEKHRLRIHGWRVLYEVDDARRLVTIWAVLKELE